jgi:hypothetical protein
VNKRGSLRASDADRDQIIERLRKAATEGRIASEELEQRVSLALKARTYGELEATVADLPGHPERRPSARRSGAGWALSAMRANPMLILFAIPVLAVTAAMVVAVTIIWAVLMVVAMVLGGRPPRAPHPPWMYARRRGPRLPGRYWA